MTPGRTAPRAGTRQRPRGPASRRPPRHRRYNLIANSAYIHEPIHWTEILLMIFYVLSGHEHHVISSDGPKTFKNFITLHIVTIQ